LASWTAANHFRLPRRGAIPPGYLADFSLSPTLNPWTPVRVFKRGVETARDGKILVSQSSWPHPPCPASPMHVTRLSAEDLQVPAQPGMLRVIGVREGTLLTEKLHKEPKVRDGLVQCDTGDDVIKLAVYNRYIPDRKPSVAFLHGLGLKKGAIAITVAHDSHNLIVAGVSDDAMVRVAGAVREAGGGAAIGAEEGPIEVLPLPIGGLMSDQPVATVAEGLKRLRDKAREWGSPLHSPLMALSFLALPVIPELKLTDMGLVDVSTFGFISLFEPV
ncbi:MAG: adenine deaminase C-terminal domain-containing protein, partial [Acidobacteriota bacterium]